jgi:hypothetical protein
MMNLNFDLYWLVPLTMTTTWSCLDAIPISFHLRESWNCERREESVEKAISEVIHGPRPVIMIAFRTLASPVMLRDWDFLDDFDCAGYITQAVRGRS